MTDSEIKEPRKVSDVLFSLEEKIILLIKTIAANDMNNKLILDRLNKLLNNGSAPSTTVNSKLNNENVAPIVATPTIVAPPVFAVSDEPIKTRKQAALTEKVVEKQQPVTTSSGNKIPVVQRVTDSAGKDLFMADVKIINIDTNEVFKVKTNAVGKWQSYLTVGTYSIHISKIIDADTLQKLESVQTIEVTPQMKALQLPIIIIKR